MSSQTVPVKRTLRRAVLLPVLAATLAGIVFLVVIQRLLTLSGEVQHSDEVVATAELSRELAVDMESGLRGYMLTRDPRFLEPYVRASSQLAAALKHLTELVAENPEQTHRAEMIRRDLAAWQRHATSQLEHPSIRDAIAGKELMDRVRRDHEAFLNAEEKLSASRAKRVHDATIVAIGITLGVVALAGAVLVIFIRRDLRQVSTGYERALSAAEELSVAKDRMLASVSHELRTPLTSILGWAGMMRIHDGDSELRSLAVNSIEQSARLQSRLVEDLLDLSRMAAGKFRIEMGSIDARTSLDAAIETLQPAADVKGIKISESVNGCDMRMSGDSARLQQVFWNLISNAVRYTPAGGHIDISAGCEDDEIVVKVADSGIGIDSAFLPHIFEAFSQESSSIRSPGLGLGLSIARQVVELHGGTITAKSEGPGRGAEFVVRLPRMKKPGDAPGSFRV